MAKRAGKDACTCTERQSRDVASARTRSVWGTGRGNIDAYLVGKTKGFIKPLALGWPEGWVGGRLGEWCVRYGWIDGMGG